MSELNIFFNRVFLIVSILRYTCDECIQGLEWVEAYIEDPIMIAEFTIYLEQNYCLSEMKLISSYLLSNSSLFTR